MMKLEVVQKWINPQKDKIKKYEVLRKQGYRVVQFDKDTFCLRWQNGYGLHCGPGYKVNLKNQSLSGFYIISNSEYKKLLRHARSLLPKTRSNRQKIEGYCKSKGYEIKHLSWEASQKIWYLRIANHFWTYEPEEGGGNYNHQIITNDELDKLNF